MRSLYPLCLALALAACASTPASDVRVVNGDPARLNRDCKLLGTVTGRSLFGGTSDQARTDAAMADARNKAGAMGATDVYFITVDTTGMLNTGNAVARAFRCDKQP